MRAGASEKCGQRRVRGATRASMLPPCAVTYMRISCACTPMRFDVRRLLTDQSTLDARCGAASHTRSASAVATSASDARRMLMCVICASAVECLISPRVVSASLLSVSGRRVEARRRASGGCKIRNRLQIQSNDKKRQAHTSNEDTRTGTRAGGEHNTREDEAVHEAVAPRVGARRRRIANGRVEAMLHVCIRLICSTLRLKLRAHAHALFIHRFRRLYLRS
jgi:hypothetical protein